MKNSICDYLKKNLSVEDYAKLIELWEVHRGADGEENVYDLMDYTDFHHFATHYGLQYALSCQEVNRFWFGGNNYDVNSCTMYKEPVQFPADSVKAYILAKSMIGDEYVVERTDLYEKYYDFEKYNKEVLWKYYEPNYEHTSHTLEYPLVLQHFSILFYENNFVNIKYLKEEYCYDDILNVVANMAYTFTELYGNTEWKTTFKDYALHFIIRHFEDSEYFGEMYESREDMLSAKYKFKEYPEYYDITCYENS